MDERYASLARLIDHSLLDPSLTADQLERGCRLALAYNVASVCVVPHYLPHCVGHLAGSALGVGTTIGFPHGGQSSATKVFEAREALMRGATELDIVVNVSDVLSERWHEVRGELAALIDLTHEQSGKAKIIFENCYLQDRHKIRLCEICSELAADWVKTSTGFGPGGATVADLKLMRQHCAGTVQLKAAGGIRDLERALEVRALGATRIGATRTATILDSWRRRLDLSQVELRR